MRRAFIAAGVIGALSALVVGFPLRWVAPSFVADGADFNYSGTIWAGRVSNVPIFAAFKYKLAGLSVDVQGQNGANVMVGNLGRTRAKDMDVQIDLSTLPMTDPRLQGLVGQLSATLDDVRWTDAGCTAAAGRVATDILQRNGGAINWTGPNLAGPISCEDGHIIARLRGKDTEQSVAADVTLMLNGDYRAEITVSTDRVEAPAVLPMFGFTGTNRDFRLTEQGRWR